MSAVPHIDERKSLPYGAETLFAVEQKRHISELKGWRYHVLRAYFVWGGRFFYFILGLPVPDVNGVWKEGQAICTTEQRADEMLQDENWFAQELPVDRCLSAETGQFRKHWFGKRSARKAYLNRRTEYVQIERETLDSIKDMAERVLENVDTGQVM